MPEETIKLAPTEPENIFLEEELDRQRLGGVSEDEISGRKAEIVTSNQVFDSSLVPHVADGIDISKIVDTSGMKPETEPPAFDVQEIGSLAAGSQVSKSDLPGEPFEPKSLDNSGLLPPPSVN